MVVLELPFLPLPFLVFVAFLPEATLPLPESADLSVEPPVACAKTRPAPSNMVNVNVRSFFMPQSYARIIKSPRAVELISLHLRCQFDLPNQ